MLFTKETDYAIRFFRTLKDGKQYPVSEIAEREMIPQQFAYKILRKLSGADFVEVTRDKRGFEVLYKYIDRNGIPAKNVYTPSLVISGHTLFLIPYSSSPSVITEIHKSFPTCALILWNIGQSGCLIPIITALVSSIYMT